jgi:hypothetical protein
MIRSCSARLQRTYASLQPWPWHSFLLAQTQLVHKRLRGFQSTYIDRCRFENDAAKNADSRKSTR